LQITSVKRNDDSGGFGNAVWAKETVPPYNTYVIGHLDGVPPDIQPGKIYPAGTKLAWTGDTVGPPYRNSKGELVNSRSTGEHLHFEVRDVNGKHVDPDSTDASGKKHVEGMGFEPGGDLDYGKPKVDPNRVRGRSKSKDYPKDKPLTGTKPPPSTPPDKAPAPGTDPQRPPPREPITDDDPLRTLMEQQLSKRLRGSRK
jgi:murein DD-endopeptidase MepM/ murein hydrolase activator NlpD